MKKITFIVLLLFVSTLVSCHLDETESIENNDYLIFGHFYGKCKGEKCIETYMLTQGKVFEDIDDRYQQDEHFNFKEVRSIRYNQVNDLFTKIPKQLLNSRTTIYGCPDCNGQGGLYIIYKKDGELKKWKIDQNKKNVPIYLHSFMDDVNKMIKLLNS